jgi:hypothetical protein
VFVFITHHNCCSFKLSKARTIQFYKSYYFECQNGLFCRHVIVPPKNWIIIEVICIYQNATTNQDNKTRPREVCLRDVLKKNFFLIQQKNDHMRRRENIKVFFPSMDTNHSIEFDNIHRFVFVFIHTN